jgi:hypothetical protein
MPGRPALPLQLSTVHGFLSSQSATLLQLQEKLPLHTPFTHLSDVVQLLPSSHGVPSAANEFAGQSTILPLQLSARSQVLALGRQMLPITTRFGQSFELPLQASATSQTPALARHGVPADATRSCGHEPLLPVQSSATSHGPVDERHTKPAVRTKSCGHEAVLPVHISAKSHADAADRHTVVAVRNRHVDGSQHGPKISSGKAADSHCSPASRTVLPHCADGIDMVATGVGGIGVAANMVVLVLVVLVLVVLVLVVSGGAVVVVVGSGSTVAGV